MIHVPLIHTPHFLLEKGVVVSDYIYDFFKE